VRLSKSQQGTFWHISKQIRSQNIYETSWRNGNGFGFNVLLPKIVSWPTIWLQQQPHYSKDQEQLIRALAEK